MGQNFSIQMAPHIQGITVKYYMDKFIIKTSFQLWV